MQTEEQEESFESLQPELTTVQVEPEVPGHSVSAYM